MVTKQNILIVDDYNNIAVLISLYLSKECFEKAVKNKGLERSFKQAIPKEVYEKLEKEMNALEIE